MDTNKQIFELTVDKNVDIKAVYRRKKKNILACKKS